MIQAKRDRPAWPLFLLILIFGVLFMLGAGQVAIQLVPNWSLIADVDSNIDPNAQLAKWSDSTRLEPVSVAILTQPAWRGTYLTPGVSVFIPPIVMGIPTSTSEANNTPLAPPTQEPGASVTPGQPTAVRSATPVIIIPTNTAVPKSSTPKPTSNNATRTFTPTITRTPTVTPTRTKTLTPTITLTQTKTLTPTVTTTATVTLTPTITVTPTITQTSTITLTPTITNTYTVTVTSTITTTPTITSTATVTSTATETLVPTDTFTPTATAALPACKTTIDLNTEPNPHTVAKEMTCFTYTNTDPAYNNGAIFQIASTGTEGNLHDGCGTEGLILGSSIDYGVWDSGPIDPGGVMVFRLNVTTPGILDIAIVPWSGSLPCP